MKAGWQADNVSTVLVTYSFNNSEIKTKPWGMGQLFYHILSTFDICRVLETHTWPLLQNA